MMQRALTDFEPAGKPTKKRKDIRRYIKLAREKYANDWAVQQWLSVYLNGTPNLTHRTKRSKTELKGIPPRSDFARRGLIKAIELREQNKVWGARK